MSHLQRIEAQLTIMLLPQLLNAINAFSPYAAQVRSVNITNGWEKSSVRQAWEQLIIDTIHLCSYLFAASGFLYIDDFESWFARAIYEDDWDGKSLESCESDRIHH